MNVLDRRLDRTQTDTASANVVLGGARVAVAPRLLTRRQAAAYCGIGSETFAMHCPVRPVSLGPGKRLERYDIVALDRWIDLLNGGSAGPSKNWLAALEDDDDGHAH